VRRARPAIPLLARREDSWVQVSDQSGYFKRDDRHNTAIARAPAPVAAAAGTDTQMVEAAGIEPASASPRLQDLRA